MSITQEEKINFLFRVARDFIRRENLVDLPEYLRLVYDFSEDDMDRALSELGDIDVMRGNGSYASYTEVEHIIRDAGFNIADAKIMMGVFYADGRFVEVIDSWEDKPRELQSILRQIERYNETGSLAETDF